MPRQRFEPPPAGTAVTDIDEKGERMGTEARIALILGAAACLLAVMVDWVIEELTTQSSPSAASSGPGPLGPAPDIASQ